MKRFLLIIIAVSMILFTGCPDEEKKESSDKKEVQNTTIDKKAAEEFLNNYLFHAIKRDTNAMLSYYSPKLIENYKEVVKNENPHPVGYKIEEGEISKESEFKVHIFNAYNAYPYFSDDTFKYKLTSKNGKLLIDEIKKEDSIELYSKGNSLYKKTGDNAQGEFIVSIEDFPAFTSAQNIIYPEQKFKVPKKKLGPCAIDSEGKIAIVSSIDVDSYIGIVRLDEEAFNMAQNGQKGQGQDQKGEGGGGEEQKSEEERQREKKEIKIKSLDFYSNKIIQIITLSPDGKTILTEISDNRGKREIKGYKGEDGSSLELEFVKQFKSDVFSTINPFFISKNEFVFSVEVKPNATDEEKRLRGDWVYNIETKKFRQIKQF
ncbi:hypothetical protein ABG79_01466 [Caloramator mitchellensis]|uniref:Lipoprotein n=1 Tax=Caloramator mitchellensis TaxID=908809 RepID=A0A0R3JUK0_CALMK|nr:hypothetical protein [Caloramator mitchellensis]KRQ86714.1 hypothetical protein ABG79_01466 [Caloramator mitchellensis]